MQDHNSGVITVGIIGNTGSGKSHFINAVLGEERAPVNNGTDSCTDKVTRYEYTVPGGQRITLVDTPGFDCRFSDAETPTLGAMEIMRRMLDDLGGAKYSYIFIIQNVTYNVVRGRDLREERRLKRLCPDTDKVFIITTHWDNLPLADELVAANLEGNLPASNCFLKYYLERKDRPPFFRSGKTAQLSGYVTPRELIQKLFEVSSGSDPDPEPQENEDSLTMKLGSGIGIPEQTMSMLNYEPPKAEENEHPLPIELRVEMPERTAEVMEELRARSRDLQDIASTLISHQKFLASLVQPSGDLDAIKKERDQALGKANALESENRRLYDQLTLTSRHSSDEYNRILADHHAREQAGEKRLEALSQDCAMFRKEAEEAKRLLDEKEEELEDERENFSLKLERVNISAKKELGRGEALAAKERELSEMAAVLQLKTDELENLKKELVKDNSSTLRTKMGKFSRDPTASTSLRAAANSDLKAAKDEAARLARQLRQATTLAEQRSREISQLQAQTQQQAQASEARIKSLEEGMKAAQVPQLPLIDNGKWPQGPQRRGAVDESTGLPLPFSQRGQSAYPPPSNQPRYRSYTPSGFSNHPLHQYSHDSPAPAPPPFPQSQPPYECNYGFSYPAPASPAPGVMVASPQMPAPHHFNSYHN